MVYFIYTKIINGYQYDQEAAFLNNFLDDADAAGPGATLRNITLGLWHYYEDTISKTKTSKLYSPVTFNKYIARKEKKGTL